MAARSTSSAQAPVYPSVPMSFNGKPINPGTDLRSLGLEDAQIAGLLEQSEATLDAPATTD